MGCCCGKSGLSNEIQLTDPNGIIVEELTLHRSTGDGELGDPVPGLFYSTEERIYARVVLNRIEPNNFEIVSCPVDPIQMNVIYAHAELPRPWPPGTYDVRFYIEGKLAQVAPFKIVDPEATESDEDALMSDDVPLRQQML
ncbi:uncharacterized protein MONOS_2212 [Monocercomonoides exilis]|uniref:uncharacterized protein n=1 Tax=Monocercomonoides exilis TaxID=2049356 RepID=UPI003559A3C2|nr:hypothetical protein MONOS_2212 [Monocercomonoides exilis]|eukprot:MONOS_2212.1-p1 / transcript=MONOS_2212.1 / gene=MONOS_2212 / organism=Monocercomonoides_exilis_PA203 / gene_product=unspecified product / transcript_product=unspecified product / location=Mono_scaffold00044:61343-62282(-) / protein_length=141 / sequence_SO=supercontig / SO=protein_coding / is_pseudo=false